MSELQFAVFNLGPVSFCQACANGDNRPNFDPCCWKAGVSLLMERELNHSLDRAVGPHYRRDARLHYAASAAFSVMASVHPTAATHHLEGLGTYGVRSPSLTVQET